MRIHHVLCFCTTQEGSGNPAAVIEEFIGSRADKAALAKKWQLPVVVFIIPGKPYKLEFFYPIGQMPLCLHGTLAAALITGQTEFITITGQQLLVHKQAANLFQVQVSAQVCENVTVDPKLICSFLNILDAGAIDTELPCSIASVGSPKLLIPLRDNKRLQDLEPNYKLITEWSREQKINGIYVYASINKQANHFQARGFNPQTGKQEDAATGVAAAALAQQLRRNIVIEQGAAMSLPCELQVNYISDQNIQIGGYCQLE